MQWWGGKQKKSHLDKKEEKEKEKKMPIWYFVSKFLFWTYPPIQRFAAYVATSNGHEEKKKNLNYFLLTK
jgi:hypothetical protein